MKLRVSGTVYGACFDPSCTSWAQEHGLPAPTVARRGFGWSYVYDVSRETARDMVSTARDVGEGWSFGCDPEAMAEARAILRWCERAEASL